MKFEFSAGGIVYKNEKRKAKSEKDIVILVAQHSQHHGWVFPKGLIGDTHKGESKESTAVREVREETGIEARIMQPLAPITYWYQFSAKGGSASGGEGEKVKKTVYYFLMEYTGGDIADHDHEMENVEWLPKEKVEERLTYKSDKKVWQEALKILNLKS